MKCLRDWVNRYDRVLLKWLEESSSSFLLMVLWKRQVSCGTESRSQMPWGKTRLYIMNPRTRQTLRTRLIASTKTSKNRVKVKMAQSWWVCVEADSVKVLTSKIGKQDLWSLSVFLTQALVTPRSSSRSTISKKSDDCKEACISTKMERWFKTSQVSTGTPNKLTVLSTRLSGASSGI